MNAGKASVVATVIFAAVTGAVLWYTSGRAYYDPVIFQPGAEIRLVPLVGDQPEAIVVTGIEGIDAESSPIKFRACFTTPLSLAMLTETYRTYEGAEPLIAPRGFDCFDAEAIDKALESGEALAFLSEPEIRPGVDRVVAVFGDGRAYAWQQLNGSLGE
ncbi:MAG: DUF6446 family protein [Pseudomonadota bacterium]